MSLATAIKSIQDVMRTDVGVDGDAQRIGQLTWLIFLKIWDDREQELELIEPHFRSPLVDVEWFDGADVQHSPDLRWRAWASDPEGATGDRLLAFVDTTLFPALKSMEAGPASRRRRGGEPTSDASAPPASYPRCLSRRVSVHEIRHSSSSSNQPLQRDIDFNDAHDRHLFGEIYEQILRELQSAGNAGEYYTPRAVTDFAIDVVHPRLGEVVMDPACGTGGFLTGAISFVRRNDVQTPEDEAELQRSIRGIEKKPLPHLLCVTNMILHGIDTPIGIRRDNALARPLRDIGGRDRVDVVVTNPPFRGMEEEGIENNFPLEIRTRETADLFLALVIELLRPGGRGAIVLPDSSLFSDGVKETLRRRLVTECDLHTIVRLPHGVFSPYTDIRTNVLFFSKAAQTRSVWFYELPCPYGDKFTKTKPIAPSDFAESEAWWDARSDTQSAWQVPVSEIARREYRLDFDNPHAEDTLAAYVRHEDARASLAAGMVDVRRTVSEALDDPSRPVGANVRKLLLEIAEVSTNTSLTSGVVEALRRSLTDLALRGEMTAPAEDDEPVALTLQRYSPANRKLRAVPQTQPPFTIPEGWAWTRLAEICDFRIGRTPSTRDKRFWLPGDAGEGTPWVAIGDMPRRGIVDTTSKRVSDIAAREVFGAEPVPAGSLLVAFKLSVGKTATLGVEAYHNEAIASLSAEDDVLRSYLVWAVPALVTHSAMNPAVRGSTLNSKSIAELWVPVPPRGEQQRVSAALAWASDLLETIADASEALRQETDTVIKLLGAGRALSSPTANST